MWINDGDSFEAGDRTLVAIRPPVFDAPTTRGLFDTSTGVYWGSDAFGMFVPSAVDDAAALPEDERWDSFYKVGSLISPWLQWVDSARYSAHVDRIERLGVEAIAACHGPGFRGSLVSEALRRVRELPRQPAFQEPDQRALEAMLAQMFQAGASEPEVPVELAS
jgi:flavorubredoxin